MYSVKIGCYREREGGSKRERKGFMKEGKCTIWVGVAFIQKIVSTCGRVSKATDDVN